MKQVTQVEPTSTFKHQKIAHVSRNFTGDGATQTATSYVPPPLELRQLVYAYILPAQIHLRLEDHVLCIANCQQPDRGGRSASSPCQELTLVALDGYERGTCPSGFAKRVSTDVWAGRLESS
ncbi:hypothetical protein HBH64_000480 [Parastagonospora nodorum]|nr:hypothetical protein HBH50_228730 [Parastagonospora nodorum]KAH4155968.1 hypothetical protein HBH43_210740 [Parastagonospora nodorum]KAH4286920.1 hypothetical protein HBI02_218560 [Parastagonospora nodorum]KAH4327139.1 hypothetical protein HBI00_126710 [Parastagonospora nodorum]KAH4400016.1 hypothetical protein HBH92_240580 [Parastagonospora nodorum]